MAAPTLDTLADVKVLETAVDVIDQDFAGTANAHDAAASQPHPIVERVHPMLGTTFTGVRHPVSTSHAEVHQFRGIKYASVPMRFRRSTLFDTYGERADATRHG